jgi:hypothetical protein
MYRRSQGVTVAEQTQHLANRILELEDQDLANRIQRLEQADKKAKWKTLSDVAAIVSVVIASGALIFSWWSLSRTQELQVSNAASTALERHFNYAANQNVWFGEEHATQPSNATSEVATSTAIHGLYTANIIYDMTENTDEARAWGNIANELLRQHRTQLQESIVQSDVRCGGLDKDFLEVARVELGENWCQGTGGVV